MRAAVYARPGDPDVIEIRDVPAPEPGPDDVTIEVAYAGLNRADLLERMGRYGPPVAARGPAIGGLEYSGTVVARGRNVHDIALGERVFGIVGGGAHAEQVVTDARSAMRLPDALSLEAAAAIPEAFITAWDALFRLGGFALGSTLVVHAAGSGVGLAAIALAKRAGGFVLGTSRTPEKLERLRALGLDAGVALDGDWPAAVRALGRGRGADLILDLVGAPVLARNLEALATGGRIVQVGTLGGASGTFSLAPLMAKRATLVGTVLRARPLNEKIALARDFAARIVPLFANGRLAPIVDRTFALADLADAHRYLESNANFGKVLIAVRGDASR
ncbi:MAG: NAD(P)H-quinone oxidoreductase [Candidatus Baltobacteraceae bacterium]